jgi:hypothetical protein
MNAGDETPPLMSLLASGAAKVGVVCHEHVCRE